MADVTCLQDHGQVFFEPDIALLVWIVLIPRRHRELPPSWHRLLEHGLEIEGVVVNTSYNLGWEALDLEGCKVVPLAGARGRLLLRHLDQYR